jgi:hypothetical protein
MARKKEVKKKVVKRKVAAPSGVPPGTRTSEEVPSKGKKVKVGKYICPKCKSRNVGKIYSFRTLFGIVPKWRCKKCGLEEMVFPRVVKR